MSTTKMDIKHIETQNLFGQEVTTVTFEIPDPEATIEVVWSNPLVGSFRAGDMHCPNITMVFGSGTLKSVTFPTAHLQEEFSPIRNMMASVITEKVVAALMEGGVPTFMEVDDDLRQRWAMLRDGLQAWARSQSQAVNTVSSLTS